MSDPEHKLEAGAPDHTSMQPSGNEMVIWSGAQTDASSNQMALRLRPVLICQRGLRIEQVQKIGVWTIGFYELSCGSQGLGGNW